MTTQLSLPSLPPAVARFVDGLARCRDLEHGRLVMLAAMTLARPAELFHPEAAVRSGHLVVPDAAFLGCVGRVVPMPQAAIALRGPQEGPLLALWHGLERFDSMQETVHNALEDWDGPWHSLDAVWADAVQALVAEAETADQRAAAFSYAGIGTPGAECTDAAHQSIAHALDRMTRLAGYTFAATDSPRDAARGPGQGTVARIA